jgi:hypothetical protein
MKEFQVSVGIQTHSSEGQGSQQEKTTAFVSVSN